MTNLKFSFSESGPGSGCGTAPKQKPIFSFKFPNVYGYTKNASNHILFSNSAWKILKMAIKSELHDGLCSGDFWNFLFSMRLSNGEFQVF